MDAITAFLIGSSAGTAMYNRWATAAMCIVPVFTIGWWQNSTSTGMRHKVEHLLRINTGGTVLSYNGADGHIHSGLFCHRCGKLNSYGAVQPASEKLSDVLNAEDAKRLLSHVARHQIYTDRLKAGLKWENGKITWPEEKERFAQLCAVHGFDKEQ